MEKIAFKRWRQGNINKNIWWKEISDDHNSYVCYYNNTVGEYAVGFSGSIIFWAKSFPYSSFDGHDEGLCYFSNDQAVKQCINKFLKKMVKLQAFA